MQRWTKTFIAAGMAAVMVAPAMAQRPEGGRGGRGGFGGFGFGGGGPRVNVFTAIQAEPVQKELALTEDQKSKVKTVVDDYQTTSREAMQGLFTRGEGERPSEEDRAKRTAEFREKADKLLAEKKPALAAVISTDQMTRLEQIVLQAKGGEALNDKDLQAKLMVTEEQKGKLASLSKDFGEKERGTFQRGEGGRPDPEAFRASMEKRNAIVKEKDTALVAVLTPAQAEQFDALKGKAFAEIDSVRNAGFGGRGGPGGQGGGRPGGDRPQRPATEN